MKLDSRDVTRIKYPSRVKDHPKWAYEAKPWAGYPHTSGNMHKSIEAHYMYRTAKQMGGNIANLGAYKGHSTATFAYGIRDGKKNGTVYAVDLFNHIGAPGEQLALLKGGIEQCGLSKYVEVCEGFTQDWAPRLAHVRFNIILIDADHHYESCKNDFELWSPMLNRNGLVMFHDVEYDTVNRVIEECLLGDKWELVEHVFKLKTLRRA
jgi:predicted O-methyltransferase YrrM